MDKVKLEEIFSVIRETPALHHQGSWMVLGYHDTIIKEEEIKCGTPACIAGHACFMFSPKGTVFDSHFYQLPGSDEDIEYAEGAQEILGLTKQEADYLFADTRTLDEILHFCELDIEDRDNFLREFYKDEEDDSWSW